MKARAFRASSSFDFRHAEMMPLIRVERRRIIKTEQPSLTSLRESESSAIAVKRKAIGVLSVSIRPLAVMNRIGKSATQQDTCCQSDVSLTLSFRYNAVAITRVSSWQRILEAGLRTETRPIRG
jgi:hypothetical protein